MLKKKTAYSRFLESEIMCVLKLTNKLWFFRKVKDGKPHGKVLKAGTNYNYFNWKVDKS